MSQNDPKDLRKGTDSGKQRKGSEGRKGGSRPTSGDTALLSGKGKFIFKDGTIYDGEYKQIDLRPLTAGNESGQTDPTVPPSTNTITTPAFIPPSTPNTTNNNATNAAAGNDIRTSLLSQTPAQIMAAAAAAAVDNGENTSGVGGAGVADGSSLTEESQYIVMVRHGVGKNVCGKTGCIYSGDWDTDKMDGKGRLEFPNGAVFEGNFHANVFQGQGEYKFADQSKFTGSWDGGVPHGAGAFVDKSKHKWAGQFFNGNAKGLVAELKQIS